MPIFSGLHYSTEYHFLRRKSREENGSRHEGKRDRKETTGQMRTELSEGHQALEGTLQLTEEQHAEQIKCFWSQILGHEFVTFGTNLIVLEDLWGRKTEEFYSQSFSRNSKFLGPHMIIYILSKLHT